MTRLGFGYERVGNNPGGKQDTLTQEVCSQCIMMAAPYPSSLGGVYQPVGETGRHCDRRICNTPTDTATLACKSTYRSFHESARGICTTVVL